MGCCEQASNELVVLPIPILPPWQTSLTGHSVLAKTDSRPFLSISSVVLQAGTANHQTGYNQLSAPGLEYGPLFTSDPIIFLL